MSDFTVITAGNSVEQVSGGSASPTRTETFSCAQSPLTGAFRNFQRVRRVITHDSLHSIGDGSISSTDASMVLRYYAIISTAAYRSFREYLAQIGI